MSSVFRSKVIRLAHSNPLLRPHLLPLLRVATFTDPVAIAEQLIATLGTRHKTNFQPTKILKTRLVWAVKRMLSAGAVFDQSSINLLAGGDPEDVDERFGGLVGFKDLNRALLDVFNGW